MMKVTVFKQKPYSEEYTNPLGVKTFRTMEYPPNHVDVEQVLNIIRQEKLKPGIDTIRSFYDTDTQMYSENCPSAFLPEYSGGSVMQPLSPLPVLSLLILIKSRFMPCLMSGI